MKIVISSGHGKYIRGASGYPVPPQLDEVDEARRVVNRVAEMWQSVGVGATTFHDDTSHDQGTNLETIVDFHNSQGPHDLDVSVHFNAYDGGAHGHETLYISNAGHDYATKVASAVSDVGFTNRGAKERGDLYFLNNTNEVAILIETCFCDNTGDSNTYRENFELICQAIAESISGKQIGERPPRPERPPPVEPPQEENRFVMTLQGYGDVRAIINGQEFIAGDRPDDCPTVTMTLSAEGGPLVVQINGQEFHNYTPPEEPEFQPNHTNIFATTFGGAVDNENSAYPPYDYLNDTELYVALPANIASESVRSHGVRVKSKVTGKEAVGKVRDKGPWLIDDDEYVFGTGQSIAEACFNAGTPLPRGPNAGKVPSNPAAIDLSPGMFKALGMTDNGLVDWDFA